MEGDRVRINFTNHLPDSATMHWHGLVVPNAMDGPGNITQVPVAPGGRYTYEFVARQHGTYFRSRWWPATGSRSRRGPGSGRT